MSRRCTRIRPKPRLKRPAEVIRRVDPYGSKRRDDPRDTVNDQGLPRKAEASTLLSLVNWPHPNYAIREAYRWQGVISHTRLLGPTRSEMYLQGQFDKGQGPTYLLGAIIVAMIIKMPSNQVGHVAEKLVNGLLNGPLVGWALAIVLALGWTAYAKYQRKMTFEEEKRIGREKSRLQEKLLGDSVESSSEQ